MVGKDGTGVEVVFFAFSFGGDWEDGGELEGGVLVVVAFLVLVELLLVVSLVGFDLVGLSFGKGLPWMSWLGVEW